MCYFTTPYHIQCGCYGKTILQDGGCIRATSQPGLSGGCDDKIDLGVENVHNPCADCVLRRVSSPDSRYFSVCANDQASEKESTSSATALPSGFLAIPTLSGRKLQLVKSISASSSRTSASSCSSTMSSFPLSRSSSDCARMLLECLPVTIPTIPRNASGVSLGPPVYRLGRQQTDGIHWRAFDGRGYENEGE